MSNNASFDKHWSILRLLSESEAGLNVQELARRTNSSIKSIRRLLKCFEDNGIPLEATVGKRGSKSWRVTGTYGAGAFKVRFDEAAAIYLATKLLQPWMGTPIGEAAKELSSKLTRTLSRRVRDYLDRAPALLHVTGTAHNSYADKSEFIDLLMRAAEDHSVIRLTYRSQQATEAVTYEVHCYGLIQNRSSIYIVAFAPHHQAVRHYKVDRIDGVEITEKKFSRPSEFDLAKHLSGAFGIFHRSNAQPVTVRIRFDRDVERYVREKQWHPSQRLSSHPDGSLIAEFDLTATEEIRAWALSFGSKAEILAPESLRTEIATELQLLTQRYAASTKKPKAPRKPRAK